MTVAPLRVCLVVGTRPEVIKMAPVLQALERRPEAFAPILITTAQHREMLAQALAAFDLTPALDLGLTHHNHTLAEFTSSALMALTDTFAELRPDLLLVQGDTSTVVSAVLAAFYQGIMVGHIEAGLRSGDMRRPFPEEANRRIASVATDLHFAPTERARQNLLHEGLPARDIFVTGNTVVDALQSLPRVARFENRALESVRWQDHRVILATVHRRENLGEDLRHICGALHDLTMRHPDVEIVFPVHLNPAVREVVFELLEHVPRVTLVDPLGYRDLLEVERRAFFFITDSGGIQEEAPAMRKPVLIVRTVTERPEVVEAGFGQLVGTERDALLAAASTLLEDPSAYAAMTGGTNPFGDGHAGERIVRILAERLGREPGAVPLGIQATS